MSKKNYDVMDGAYDDVPLICKTGVIFCECGEDLNLAIYSGYTFILI